MENSSNHLLDILHDVIASIAFSTIVTDATGASVIHVDSSAPNQLVISICNQTSSEITVAPLSGAPTSSNNNVVLQMPNNQLYFYGAPSIDASSAPGTWTLVTNSSSRGRGWVDSIYLANAAGAHLTGSTPPQSMGLMANAGRPSPLVGSFVGPQTVLNDGTTKQDLTLRMINTSLDPLQFIVPVSGESTQSYLEVILPVSDRAADALWALCDLASWALIEISLASNASTGWHVEKSKMNRMPNNTC